MKASLLALALGLASTSAFAADGKITFAGSVNNSTCSIQVIDPITTAPIDRLVLGDANVKDFTMTGQVGHQREFELSITPGAGNCAPGSNKKATVTFDTAYTSTTFFELNPTLANPATGVAIAIKDATGAFVAPGVPSAPFEFSTAEQRLRYWGMMISTADAVGVGAVESIVEITLATN